jgi:hypothetical protein
MMVFKSEPSRFAESMRPPLRSRKKSLPDVAAFFASTSVVIKAVVPCSNLLSNPSGLFSSDKVRQQQSGFESRRSAMNKLENSLMVFKRCSSILFLLYLTDFVGAGDRDRTGDIQLGKLTFCH